MRIQDLIGRARTAVTEGRPDPLTHGLMRLPGGMTQDVFAPIDDSTLVVKVFRTGDHDEPEHEWGALVALAGSGIAPDPIHYDPGNPAAVVMSRVFGSSLPSGALHAEHAWRIGAAHRLVHQAVPWSPRPMSHRGVRGAQRALALDEALPDGRGPDIELEAWRAAKAWIANDDVEELLSSTNLSFSRGDPNLTNYIWTDEALVLIDWENSGFSDPVLELADMAEHPSTRTLGDDFWAALADATELTRADRARLARARKAMACFWIVIIGSRQRDGLPTTVTLEEQSHRTLAVLHL